MVRHVKKSFSLDRPSGGYPGRLSGNTAATTTAVYPSNIGEDVSSHGMGRHSQNRTSSSFRQSLSLDAGCILMGSGASEMSIRSLFWSTNSDSYDSSAAAELETTPTKRSDDSAFESLSQPSESLEHHHQHHSRSESEPVGSYLGAVEKAEVQTRSGVELHAHRVVIAAGCEWFKRALLSGMKEAIDRFVIYRKAN